LAIPSNKIRDDINDPIYSLSGVLSVK